MTTGGINCRVCGNEYEQKDLASVALVAGSPLCASCTKAAVAAFAVKKPVMVEGRTARRLTPLLTPSVA